MDTWMHNRSYFWKSFRSQRADEAQSLHMYEKWNFCCTFSILWQRQSWKACHFVIFLVSGPYVKPLFADAIYSDHTTVNLLQPIEMRLS